MARMRLLILLSLLAALASASVPTFCKCTCFQNSTIIPLGPQNDQPAPAPAPPSSPSSSSSAAAAAAAATTTTTSDSDSDSKTTRSTSPNTARKRAPPLPRAASSSCAQCNRAFCLQYNLPICRDAEEKDVTTSCFQRDSRRDRVVVWVFMLGTGALLGWAGARRALARTTTRLGSGGFVGGGRARGGGGEGGGSAEGGVGERTRTGMRTATRYGGGGGRGSSGEWDASVGDGGGGGRGVFGFVAGLFGRRDSQAGSGSWRTGPRRSVSGVDRRLYSPLDSDGGALHGHG